MKGVEMIETGVLTKKEDQEVQLIPRRKEKKTIIRSTGMVY